MRWLWTVPFLMACGGHLRPDPLPAPDKRPMPPYLCAVNRGGSGEIIVRTSDARENRLMTVGSWGTVCKSLPHLQEVYIGFEPTAGYHHQRIYWTPMPLRPLSEGVDCYFVEIVSAESAISSIRPYCIEEPDS